MKRKMIEQGKLQCPKKHLRNYFISWILIIAMLFSGGWFGCFEDGIVYAKSKKMMTIIVGASSRAIIAKSQKDVIYTYRSSNPKIAKITSNGVVTGVKTGKANIIRYYTKNKKTKIDEVIMYQVQKLKIKGPGTIYTSGNYYYSTNGKNITWKISKKKYATLSKKGKLSPKKQGKITLTAKSGTQTTKKKITIKKDCIDHLDVKYVGMAAYKGNTIKPEDYVVQAVYKSKRKKQVYTFLLNKQAYSVVGTDQIEISYGNCKKKVKVPVQEKYVTSLQANYLGDPLAVGQLVSNNQFQVSAVYSDGAIKRLADDEFQLSNNIAIQKGNLGVIVTHKASKVQVTVNVSVSALTITGVDTQYSGDVLYTEDGVDPGKVKIMVTYEDGSTALVDAANIRIGSVTSEDGKAKIVLYYTVDGKEYSTILSVVEKSRKLTGLVVESQNPVVYVNQNLNSNNFVVKAQYSDGTDKVISDWQSDYQISSEAGNKQVTFEYTEDSITVKATTDVEIRNVKMSGIKVTKPISNVKEGKALDYSQMEVVACFDDGGQEVVSGFTTDYDKNNTQCGDRTVTVRYAGFDTTTIVHVDEKKVIGISATNPTAVTFRGQNLNTTGMIVTGQFDNDTSQHITDYTTNYSTSWPAGVHTLVISYQNAVCQVAIQVSEVLQITQSATSAIVGHTVTLTSNQTDVVFSVIQGDAACVKADSTVCNVIPKVTGNIIIRATRNSTGEMKDTTITAQAFKMGYVNTAGGNAAEGDILQFTSNSPAIFSYQLVAEEDGKTYSGTSSYSKTSYNYTANKRGVLTMIVRDIVSGAILEKSVTVRKPLVISGSSSVKVGSTITLTTTKQVVTWSSASNSIATVTSKGVVKGIKKGSVVITATFPEYGNRTAKKTITVTS